MFSMLVSTSRAKVNMLKTIKAGTTAATNGARRCVAAAKKPNATRALDSRYVSGRTGASFLAASSSDSPTSAPSLSRSGGRWQERWGI